MSQINIPTPLRSFVDHNETLNFNAQTLRELLIMMTDQYPKIKYNLFNNDGTLRKYINIFVNDTDIRDLNGIDTELKNEDEVSLIPAIAGGR